MVLAQAGLAGLDDVHAQRSCDSVVSGGCSEDSNGAAENSDDDGDDDSEGNSAGIESKIPSTVGVPFP